VKRLPIHLKKRSEERHPMYLLEVRHFAHIYDTSSRELEQNSTIDSGISCAYEKS